MQENKPPLTFKNTKKNICLEKKREFFLTLTPTTDVMCTEMDNKTGKIRHTYINEYKKEHLVMR